MNNEEIIRMAREAGFDPDYFDNIECSCDECNFLKEPLERFAALAFEAGAAHERDACAKVADGELMNTNMLTSYPPKSTAAWNIAKAIRARGENNE